MHCLLQILTIVAFKNIQENVHGLFFFLFFTAINNGNGCATYWLFLINPLIKFVNESPRRESAHLLVHEVQDHNYEVTM